MAAAKVETIRKRQLAQALVEETGFKLKTATAIVDFIFDQIGDAMVKGKKVNVKDFGIFVKAKRAARMGRNPATGEPIKIKASTKPRFTPSKTLKESMTARKYPDHADEDALKALKEEDKPTAKKKTAKKSTAKKSTAKKSTAKKKTAKKSTAKKSTAKKSTAKKSTAKKKTSKKKTSRR